jgi:hypothetical protein
MRSRRDLPGNHREGICGPVMFFPYGKEKRRRVYCRLNLAYIHPENRWIIAVSRDRGDYEKRCSQESDSTAGLLHRIKLPDMLLLKHR